MMQDPQLQALADRRRLYDAMVLPALLEAFHRACCRPSTPSGPTPPWPSSSSSTATATMPWPRSTT